MKTGYSIRTWRMRLVCPEPIWLDRTEEYFQNVVEFYYHLLRQHEELWNSSLFDIQRSLELLTLAGRDGRQPTNPLPMGKVPVYLRRAAINKASATVKSTQELQSGFPEKLEAKVTFFKGMYSDLTDRSICLKLQIQTADAVLCRSQHLFQLIQAADIHILKKGINNHREIHAGNHLGPCFQAMLPQ